MPSHIKSLQPLWALLVTACISTDAEPTPDTFPCAGGPVEASPEGSIVLIGLTDGDSADTCPGVVIAPSLLITAASCLLPSVGPRLFANQTPACDLEAGSPLEEGEFSAWIDQTPNVRDLAIYLANGEGTPPLAVQGAYSSGATSRCGDDLALAYVPEGLPSSGTPLRLEDSTSVGESVRLAGLEGRDGMWVANEAPGLITRLTDESGDTDLPPHAMLVAGQVCSIARGGGVFSSATGALIGIIAWASEDCSDPEGTTVALRLSPYRRYLVDTAVNLGQPLSAETQTLDGRRLLPCPR